MPQGGSLSALTARYPVARMATMNSRTVPHQSVTGANPVAFAALAAELTLTAAAPSVYGLPGTPATVAPTAFRLLPYGRFRAADGSGRPLDAPAGWSLDLAGAQRIVAQWAARAKRLVIDYEHQTLATATNGQPAPAAGWPARLEARADGLYAVDVEWTGRAAAMIAAREYRYVSPVFSYAPVTGEVLSLAHVALTNDPGLDGLTDLAALRASASFAALSFSNFSNPPHPKEEAPMKELLKALGLAETATEAEALTALAALKNTQATELAALKAAVPDPAKFVATATLTAVQGQLAQANADLAALKAAGAAAEVEAVVTAAMDAGKLIPATEGWARELGKSNLAALKSFVASAPVVVAPGSTQTGHAAPAGGAGGTGAGASTPAELAVMKALGLTAEQFAGGKQTGQGA